MTHVKTSFLEFILEYNQNLNEATTSEPIGKEMPWSFNFDSGKFKLEDIPEGDLGKIYNDFEKNILPILNNQNYIGQKIDIKLTASTSKVPLGSGVVKALKEEKYEGSNSGLAKARLETLSSIIKELLYKYFKKGDEDIKDFLKDLSDKVTITKNAMPNQGPDYKQGDDPKDEKFKAVQKLSALMGVIGEQIDEPSKLKCGATLRGTGSKGSAEDLYCGYDKKLYAVAKKGTTMKIQFDPFTVPDSFIYSYGGKIGLSPFAGSHGGLMLKPFDQVAFDKINNLAKTGKVEAVAKEKIKGKDYIVYAYKKILNEVYNKDNSLVNAITKKLVSMGEKRSIKEIQPKFFDSEGKIEVYALLTDLDKGAAPDTNPVLGTEHLAFTKEAIKNGLIAKPTVIAKEDFAFTLLKDFKRDAMQLAVFSPLGGTSFSLSAVCTPPSDKK
jgi:hypothetical protein